MLKKILVTLTATLVFFAGTASAATQATQSILPTGMPTNNEGFTIVPANPNAVNPRKFIYELKPGTSITDEAYIKNFSNQKVTFALYGADPTTSNTGSLAYKTRAESGKDTGKWVQFEQPTVELGPSEVKMVKFTITVPADTTLGDYRIGAAMERTKQDTGNSSVTIATRIVLHTETKVTNDPKPIIKQDVAAGQTSTVQQSTWKTYYFWISLILFILSLGLVVWTSFMNPSEEKSSTATSKKDQTPRRGSDKKRASHKKNEGKRRNPRV